MVVVGELKLASLSPVDTMHPTMSTTGGKGSCCSKWRLTNMAILSSEAWCHYLCEWSVPAQPSSE